MENNKQKRVHICRQLIPHCAPKSKCFTVCKVSLIVFAILCVARLLQCACPAVAVLHLSARVPFWLLYPTRFYRFASRPVAVKRRMQTAVSTRNTLSVFCCNGSYSLICPRPCAGTCRWDRCTTANSAFVSNLGVCLRLAALRPLEGDSSEHEQQDWTLPERHHLLALSESR